VRAALIRTAKPTSFAEASELGYDADGQIGIGALCDAGLGRVKYGQWQHLTFAVSARMGVTCYIDGEAFAPMSDIAEVALDGPLSLSIIEGLVVGGSANERFMQGVELRSVTVWAQCMGRMEVRIAE